MKAPPVPTDRRSFRVGFALVFVVLGWAWAVHIHNENHGPGDQLYLCFQDTPSQVVHWVPANQGRPYYLTVPTAYCGFGYAPNKTAWPDTGGYPPIDPDTGRPN